MLRLYNVVSFSLYIASATAAGTQRELPLIRSYEFLDYVPAHHLARRSRRSLSDDPPIHIQFFAHQRPFHLILRPTSSSDVIARDHRFEFNGELQDPPHFQFFEGHVKGDSHSHAEGSVFDGIFDGIVHTSNGTFHVEKASKYGLLKENSSHSIIYPDHAIDDSILDRHRRSIYGRGCAFNGMVKSGMERIQKSHAQSQPAEDQGPARFNEQVESDSSHAWPDRWKRQILGGTQPTEHERDAEGLYRVRMCSVYIQTDQILWEHIYNNEGQRNIQRTKEEIYALITSHIRAVKKIYEETDFHGIKGLTFVVQRITIFEPSSCNRQPLGLLGGNENPFCDNNVDVSYFLNLNSKKDHSSFCLAYALTYRDFVGGTLGLAWVASPNSGASGGICEVFKFYNEGKGRVKRSLNTGIITLVNYNNRVPPKVSQLTLAHEIGHSFGAQHDPKECQPGVSVGNFIMFASATSGDKSNNAEFSPCSKENISQVMRAILRLAPVRPDQGLGGHSNKRNCLMRAEEAFCGNKIVEDGEVCDCGFDLVECREREGRAPQEDTCCSPRNSPGGSRCTLRNNVPCSFKLKQLARYYQPNLQGIMLRPGHPCDNYLGYCDVFQICRSVDSSGPLSRLKDLLFNPATFKNIGKWVEEYWWAVILIAIGLTLFMALFIKCCAVHTPSSNPNRAPAHSIYETLRHPSSLMRGEGGHRHRHHRAGDPSSSRGEPSDPEHRHRHRRRHRDPHDARGRSGQSRGVGESQQASRSANARSPATQQSPSSRNGVPLAMSPEPPPPYSASGPSADPPAGPARGHRRNRDKNKK